MIFFFALSFDDYLFTLPNKMPGGSQLSDMLPCAAIRNTMSTVYFFSQRCEMRKIRCVLEANDWPRTEKVSLQMKFQAPKCIRLHKHVLASNCLPQISNPRAIFETYAPTRNKRFATFSNIFQRSRLKLRLVTRLCSSAHIDAILSISGLLFTKGLKFFQREREKKNE